MQTLGSPTPTQAPPLPESPYRGIESFRYIDQAVFSARDDETWNLLSIILIYRGVLLYGDSGSGKSSLINAGLIPAALKENLVANRLRIQPRRGKEIKIERIPTESDDKPPYLSSAFIEAGSSNDEPLSIEISLTEFYTRLETLRGATSDSPRPLLIFDQFEEYITLFEEALRGGETQEAKLAQKEAPEVQQSVLNTLTKLLEDQTLPVKVLFVFREDYLAKLNLLFEACPDLSDQYVRLLPPLVQEAEKIIRAPFVKEELKNGFKEVPGKGGKEIPEHLAKAIAAQLQERSENGFINLSELQIVCSKLWESADPVRLFEEKDGNIQKILEDHWADVLRKLGKLYDAAIALLGHMVTSSNTRNIVSEPDLKNDEKDNFESKQIDDALDALVERKLVRREPRHKIYFYEIASEFLVPWIQQKKAARLAEIQARKLAAEAEQKLQQAERQKRNFMIGAIVLGSLLILAVALAFYSLYLRNKAKRLLLEAEVATQALQIEKDRSDKIIELLGHLSSRNSQDRLLAVQELDELVKSKMLQPDMAPVILATIVNDKDPAVSNAALKLLPLATQEGGNKDLTESIIKSAENNTELANKLPPRVYIQMPSTNERPRADKIAGALRSIGAVVPAYQVVGSSHSPSQNQLRYYKLPSGSASPSGATTAEDVLRTLKAADGAPWSLKPLDASSRVRPGHFEIWFAADATVENVAVVQAFKIDNAELIPQLNLATRLNVSVSYDYQGSEASRTYLEASAFQQNGKQIPTTSGAVFVKAGKAQAIVVAVKNEGEAVVKIAKIKVCMRIANGENVACTTRDYSLNWQ